MNNLLTLVLRLIIFSLMCMAVFAVCLLFLPDEYSLWSFIIAPIIAWIFLPKRKENGSDAPSEQKRITPVLRSPASKNELVNEPTNFETEVVEEKPKNGTKNVLANLAILSVIAAGSWYAWDKYQISLQTPEAIAAREAKIAERAAEEKLRIAERAAEEKLRQEEKKRKAENAIIAECKDILYADATGQCKTLESAQKIQVAMKRLKAVDPMQKCMNETRVRSRAPSKVDFSWSGTSELITYYDGAVVSIINLSGETMNGLGLMVPFISTCKIRKKIDNDEIPEFYEFFVR